MCGAHPVLDSFIGDQLSLREPYGDQPLLIVMYSNQSLLGIICDAQPLLGANLWRSAASLGYRLLSSVVVRHI